VIPATAFIQLFLDALHSLASFYRGAQHKVKGKEAVTVGPSQAQKLETLEFAATVVIKNPGKQLHYLGPGAIIGVIIKDQDLLPAFIGQQVKEPDDYRHQGHHEFAPVMPWIFEELVGRVLAKSQAGVVHSALGEVDATKGQRENDCEQGGHRHTPHLLDAVSMEQGTYLEITHEGRYPALQFVCFLLLPVLFGIVHASLSFLILLSFLQIPMCQKAKGFSR
jgi:hypothetical protein